MRHRFFHLLVLCISYDSRFASLAARPETLLERADSGTELSEGDLKGCLATAKVDLAELKVRMEQRYRNDTLAEACLRGAHELYCEAVHDAAAPKFFENKCGTDESKAPVMEMRAEPKEISLLYLIFMTHEVTNVKQMVKQRGANDSVLIHVDQKNPKAFKQLKEWTKGSKNIMVESRWSVVRAGYSAGASLLDLLDVAAEKIPGWETVIFLSGSHFPIRPRSAIARLFWYYPFNYASSEEGLQKIYEDPALSYHYKLSYECAEHAWDITKDRHGEGVIMKSLGHPNITVGLGSPFVVLQRDFVEWLGQTRKVVGSPTWVLLRHILRTWCNVEKMFQTILLNTEWCHKSQFIFDPTLVKGGQDEQVMQHVSESERTDGIQAHSALELNSTDLELIDSSVLGSSMGNAFIGGVSNTMIEKEDDPGFRPGTAPTWVAFARKVKSKDFRQELKEQIKEIPADWWAMAWPLAKHAWKLYEPCKKEPKEAVHTFHKLCGPETLRIPCAEEIVLPVAGCDYAIILKPKVGIGRTVLHNVQIGAQFNKTHQRFISPNIFHNKESGLIKVMMAFRRHSEIESDMQGTFNFTNPVGEKTSLEAPFRLKDQKSGLYSGFGGDGMKTHPGEWKFQARRVADGKHRDGVLAERTFFVYEKKEQVKKEILERYFDVEVTLVPPALNMTLDLEPDIPQAINPEL
eukprot:TRINITY_DN39450_c0_g1_i1.p1 TRINITY_DN39450_c0_g1~~TRINITY_DN39450_c0_g1_i1.p1  ORF type:complete len:690 (-),score=111.01 TRINITY_DN39450_c0_g1_i1:17-2086(-)